MRPIYFDYNATTPVSSTVLEAMIPWFSQDFANPSSRHSEGQWAMKKVQESLQSMADLLSAKVDELTLTSGATEACNLALRGFVEQYAAFSPHIVVFEDEHPAVLETARALKSFSEIRTRKNWNAPLPKGKLVLFCSLLANNETGQIYPIADYKQFCEENNALLFLDATQAIGKIPVSVVQLRADILAFSAHKFYGPKGIGGLFCRSGIQLKPQLTGGGQQAGRRGGTLPTPLIVGLGIAAAEAHIRLQERTHHLLKLKEEFEDFLIKFPQNFRILEKESPRLPNTLAVQFYGLGAREIQVRMPGVLLSSGSACASGSTAPSHVYKSLGLSDDEARSVMRFSFGEQNTMDELKHCIQLIQKAWKL